MGKTKNEQEQAAIDYMAKYQNDPDFIGRMKERLGDKAFSNFMTLGANIMDINTSRQQINKADLLEDQLKKPSIYTPTRGDENLRTAISDAQRGIYDNKVQLAPAELVNMENYFNDLNNAKIASTGQAGQYGALAQGASLRRQRGGNQIAAMNAGLISDKQKRYDSLVGMQLENNAGFEGRMLGANQLQLADYYKQAEANALLGSTGRSNMRNSIYNVLPTISDTYKNTRALGRDEYGTSASDNINKFGSMIGGGIQNLFSKGYQPYDEFGLSQFRGNASPYPDYVNAGIDNYNY